MHDDAQSSSLGAGLIVWFVAFAASWVILSAATRSSGLTLVLSVFVALIAFDVGRRSLRLALAIIGFCFLVILLKLIYLSFA